MFANLLNESDAQRATGVVALLAEHGLRSALTGGFAIAAQLRDHGRPVELRPLNDLDVIVESFASIPQSLTRSFLQHHVHPDATDGRTLLQLVHVQFRVRVDLFAALGQSLDRAHRLSETDECDVLSLEDLVARTTALVCGRARRRQPIDSKHVAAFKQLRGLGDSTKLSAAWADHRQSGHRYSR